MGELKTLPNIADKLEAQLINSIPLSRMGKAAEVAGMIRFLASEEAAFITGSNFLVDGGQSI